MIFPVFVQREGNKAQTSTKIIQNILLEGFLQFLVIILGSFEMSLFFNILEEFYIKGWDVIMYLEEKTSLYFVFF